MSLTSNHLNRDEQIRALAEEFVKQHGNDFRVIDGKWWALHPVLQVWSVARARDRAAKQLTQVVGSLDPALCSWIYGAIGKSYIQAKVLAYLSHELRAQSVPGPGWTPHLANRYPEARF